MPPPELPGFYWDEERNRYFPSSLRPANRPAPAGPSRNNDIKPSAGYNNANRTDSHVPRKRQKISENHSNAQLLDTWSLIDRLRNGTTFNDAQRLKSIVELRQIPKLHCDSVNSVSEGNILSFAPTRRLDGSFTAIVGDHQGWVLTHESTAPQIPMRELYMGAPVNSVCSDSELRVAVSFGASCELSVQPLADPPEDMDVWTLMRLSGRLYHDVRDAHLLNKSVLLGAAGCGILCTEVERDDSLTYCVFPTGSDVLSVHQSGQLCFLGCRNGSVQGFDRRIPSDSDCKTIDFLNGRYKGSGHSIVHLSVVHDWQLLVSTIGGLLETHDLRFSRNKDPLMRFEGHTNKFTEKLGLAVSPEHDLLFAASDEHKVNAWSLRTGECIAPLKETAQSTENRLLSLVPLQKRSPVLLKEPFPSEIPALQVTDGDPGVNHELCLWVASGKGLYKYKYKAQPQP